jgi:hypothetical protein
MKTILKISVVVSALVLMLIADMLLLRVQLVPEAQAIFGVWRRAARRTVVVGSVVAASSATAAAATETAAAQQQAAAAQQQATAAKQEAAAAQQQANAAKQQAAAAAGTPLPLGTVVSTLPAGCTSTPVGGVAYYYCGGNFYRAVFQGNSLVYVTVQPK